MKFVKNKQAFIWVVTNKNILIFSWGWISQRNSPKVYRIGISWKHGKRSGKWRMWNLFTETGKSNGYGRIYKIELCTNLATKQVKGRILKTKKYIRLKLCI